MKKILLIAALALSPLSVGAQLLVPQGATGLASVPPGYLLTGYSNLRLVSKYLVAGSNVTISSTTDAITISASVTGGGGVSDWLKAYNFGQLMLSPTTSIPLWANNGLYASSTSVFNGRTFMKRLIMASTTFSGTNPDDLQDGIYSMGPIRSRVLEQKCSMPVVLSSATADGTLTCSDGAVQVQGDGTMVANAVALTSGEYNTYISSAVTANSGAGFFAPVAGNVVSVGTSSPVFEVAGRIWSTLTATSTTVRMGFTTTAANGTTFDEIPAGGFYFAASSSNANWYAICKRSGVATTTINTGYASSTSVVASAGSGQNIGFRITATSTGALFEMQYPWRQNVPWRIVGHCTSSVMPLPQTLLVPGFYEAHVGAGTARAISMSYWYLGILPVSQKD